jgi:hypothetical protein
MQGFSNAEIRRALARDPDCTDLTPIRDAAVFLYHAMLVQFAQVVGDQVLMSPDRFDQFLDMHIGEGQRLQQLPSNLVAKVCRNSGVGYSVSNIMFTPNRLHQFRLILYHILIHSNHIFMISEWVCYL